MKYRPSPDFVAALALLFFGVLIALAGCASAPKRTGLPPTFLSGVATYDTDQRFVALRTGTTRFLSCREALDDARVSLEKAIEYQPKGARSVGLCIPLHTYTMADFRPPGSQ